MRVLVTGSSGWLGTTLVPRLRALGQHVVGLDVKPGPNTSVVGSATDRGLIDRALAAERVTAIVHAAALHKPDIARFPASDFVAVNIQGTLNLLEGAVAAGVDRFVFTSTTSLMISSAIRTGREGGAARAAWIDESMSPLEPRNIYGVTKLAAEQLCRMTFQERGLPVVVLRTGRFFPEADDMAHVIEQSDENTKANEFLFRRLTVKDAAEAHVAALAHAPALGFGTYIVAAPTPFRPEDCEELIHDAPSVVARHFPDYPALYRRRGWSMFRSIDRVYSAARAETDLSFRCRTGFSEGWRPSPTKAGASAHHGSLGSRHPHDHERTESSVLPPRRVGQHLLLAETDAAVGAVCPGRCGIRAAGPPRSKLARGPLPRP